MLALGDRDGRGQVVIVAGLLIAILLVGLALVVNSGIYAENLSSRETTDSDAASAFTGDAHDTVASAYREANDADETTADGARSTFAAVVDAWIERRAELAASEGSSVALDRTAHVGWRLHQGTDRPFTPADDPNATDWQVAAGARNVSAFRLDVTRASLYDASTNFGDTGSEAFRIRVTDGTDEWQLYVFRDSVNSSIVVHRGDPGDFADLGALRDDPRTCTRSQSRAVVDLREEQFAGTNCDALAFAAGLDGAIDVHYENVRASPDGEFRVEGQYTQVVNGSTAIATDAADEPQRFNAPGGDAPTAQAVVYSASYTTYFERSDIEYVRDGEYAVREESYAA